MLEDGEKMQLAYNVRNVHRAVGTRLSAHITRRYGMDQLPPGHITVRLRGSAGQSLGAFAVQGLKLEVFGDANDYVGKGLSGGTIVVRPLPSLADRLGRQRRSSATPASMAPPPASCSPPAAPASASPSATPAPSTVVEGCGDNGCEYMTGGVAVILGPVGDNFAAGMSGGMAYVWDPEDRSAERINADMVIWQRPEVAALRSTSSARSWPSTHAAHPEPARRAHPARLRPRARPFLAGRAQGDAGPAGGAGGARWDRRAHRLTGRHAAVARCRPRPPSRHGAAPPCQNSGGRCEPSTK